MKDCYLIRVYRVPNVRVYPEQGARDDIDEQTEDQLEAEKDFMFQMQGDTLKSLGMRLIRAA